MSLLRPRDRGRPHDAYFRRLQAVLREHGPMRPALVVDLDALDHNIDLVAASVARGGKHLRLVEKSLPSPGLLGYILDRLSRHDGSAGQRLMSFHQPFLNQDARHFPRADILLGKPLPVRSAALFYREHADHAGAAGSVFDPARQLQWLVDTPARLRDYLALAEGLGTRLRINIELDVGLHRGGVADRETLRTMLEIIRDNPQRLGFAGFMGYDPFVVMLPALLGSRETLLARVLSVYQEQVALLHEAFPGLGTPAAGEPAPTFNTAGSPTYRLHEAERVSNDIAVGSALLMPAHFDIDTLAQHRPALFIATPVLKTTGPVRIPGLGAGSRLLSWWDVNRRETAFLYGGNWMADYVSPPGVHANSLYGRSSNQEIANVSPSAGLRVDDLVFLRPRQSEAVLLQFGELLAVRGDRLAERWPVYAD